MSTRDARRERGEVQRARLRRLVAGGDGPPKRGVAEAVDLAGRGRAATWWARQERYGAGVTEPARQIAATVHHTGLSPNSGALLFELGRVVYGYSRWLVQEIGRAAAEPLALPVGSPRRVSQVCIACRAAVEAERWDDGELGFLRVGCERCGAVTTLAGVPTRGVGEWPRPVLAGEGPDRSLTLAVGLASAASLGAHLLDVPVGPAGPVTVALPVHTGAVAGTRSRLVATLDLLPAELVW